jgi:tRNA (guanine-N7-)-methyltransferase
MSEPKNTVLNKPLRIVRSFVLRQGRATPSQKRAFEQHWTSYGLDYSGSILDINQLFSKPAATVIEIGFGNAEQLLFSAQQEPEKNFIGIEVHAPGVGRALNGIAQLQLSNVRVYQHDAVEVIRDEIADGSLEEIRIYFPDPWHKKRHHKRRIIQPEFLKLICRKLKPGGLVHLATDWQEYAEHMWDVCDNEPMLRNSKEPRGFIPRPAWRMQTHFETRGQNLGHGVWDLLYIRQGTP